jgi:hypothetical protein
MKRRRYVLLLSLLAAIVLLPEAIRVLRRLFENHRVMQVALADVNNDGHLDAFLATGGGGAVHAPYVLINDGAGRFGHDVRALDNWPGDSVTLGDLNGDGFADALLGLAGGAIVRYLNDGRGGFPAWDYLTPPAPLGVMWVPPLVGDLNNNGRMDVLAAGCCGREAEMAPGNTPLLSYTQVWLSDDAGRLDESYQVGELGSNGAALADLDGDGSLDVFLANGRTLDAAGHWHPNTPNAILFNDGQGHFTIGGQELGQAESMAVALGDLNGDGFVDAAVGNRGPDEIWFNDGRGFFVDSGQRLGTGLTHYVHMVDLNQDGHLDLVVLGEAGGQVWLNDGRGHFSAGQEIRHARSAAPAVGDVTGDGLADIFVADVDSYQIWRGEGNGRFQAGARRGYR